MTPTAPSVSRTVFDTNVVLSSLVFTNGVMAHLRRSWQSGAVIPLASTPTIAELIRVLAYPKFKLGKADQNELLSDYLPWCEVVTIPSPPPVAPQCRDPFDLPFLELAIAGRADALVTGDAGLLALAGQVTFAIVTPADYLASLT